MSNEINNAIINITTPKPIGVKGFGGILIAGTSARGETMQLVLGTGTAGLRWAAESSGTKYIGVEYVDPGVPDTALSVSLTGSGTKSSPYKITATLGTDVNGDISSTAADIKSAAEAVAGVAGGSGIVTVSLVESPGDGYASVQNLQPLGAVSSPETDLKTYSNPDDMLLDGYLESSPEYISVSAMYSQEVKPAEVKVFQLSSYDNLATEMAALIDAGYDDWYHFLVGSRDKADIVKAMSYISTHERHGYFCTSDQTIQDEAIPMNCSVMVHNEPNTYPEAAWVGYAAPQTIGQITWDSVPLTGYNVSGVTETEKNTLISKGINIIGKMGSVNVSWPGTAGGGSSNFTFIDINHGRDVLSARLAESFWNLKINNPKVGMTQTGLNMIEATYGPFASLDSYGLR